MKFPDFLSPDLNPIDSLSGQFWKEMLVLNLRNLKPFNKFLVKNWNKISPYFSRVRSHRFRAVVKNKLGILKMMVQGKPNSVK